MKAAPQLTTLLFVLMWYGLNVGFNLLNKSIFNYFPFPYTVSAIHVVVGLLYCSVAYLVGAKKASFGRVSHLHACAWRYPHADCLLQSREAHSESITGMCRHVRTCWPAKCGARLELCVAHAQCTLRLVGNS